MLTNKIKNLIVLKTTIPGMYVDLCAMSENDEVEWTHEKINGERILSEVVKVNGILSEVVKVNGECILSEVVKGKPLK